MTTPDPAAGAGTSHVWPAWLERQLDTASPAHVADQALPGVVNVTARNATALGNLDSSRYALVDGWGLVTPIASSGAVVPTAGRRSGWSLDWWIGTDDRWHLPSREVAVRQRLLGGAPVVETLLRIPGGDAVQRAYAARVGERELVVVEVENQSPTPVALALAVRPYDGLSLTRIERIELVGGTTVMVDRMAALFLPRRPSRLARSTGAAGDVAGVVLAGGGDDALASSGVWGVDDPDGSATAAFVWPLPHRTTLRVAMPLAPEPLPIPRRWRPPRRRAPAVVPAVDLSSVPAAARVANGWVAHGAKGIRLVVPDGRLAAAVDAARRHLLVGTGGALGTSPSVLGALDRYGLAAEVEHQLRRLPEQLRVQGAFAASASGVSGPDADGKVLCAAATHWRLHRDRELVRDLAPTVATAAETIARSLAARGGSSAGPSTWQLAGLDAAAALLAAAGEDRAATDVARHAAAARANLDLPVRASEDRRPAAPWPLGTDAAPDERLRGRHQALTALGVVAGEGVPTPEGTSLDLGRTVEAALVDLELGVPQALDRLRWLLDVATPTWTWPTAVHPRLGGGARGNSHDADVTAGVLTLVRQLLVREVNGGLALLSLFPEAWLGQAVEVHDAPTEHGLVSFAVRWHGDRPALLWELAPHEGPTAPVILTLPGLDRSWSTIEPRGEALLAPVPVPMPATKVRVGGRRRPTL